MCGIVVVSGTGTDPALFDRMMATIRMRGEVEGRLCDQRVLAGTHRLMIVDRDRAVQPWTSADGRWVLCYNGEVYNYRQLRAALRACGRELRTESDTEVVLEAFLQWGEQAVRHLEGEFAFAAVERATGRMYVARDPVGVKPLYWSEREDRLHVASEVKALVPVGVPVHEVPPGHHGWAGPGTPPLLAPYVDLAHMGDGEEPIEDPEEAGRQLRAALGHSIRARLDTDLTVGVILSGGLDSALTLLHVARMHPDCVAFTVGTPDSEDLAFSRRLAQELGVRHEVVELRPGDLGLSDVRRAIRVSELTEYGDIINAVVSDRIFQRVHASGVKVVLSGDGSDELFGGYDMYTSVGDAFRQRLFQYSLCALSRTELQRVDRTSMAHGVEVRVPFLDLSMVRLALRLPIGLKVRDGEEKWILRQAFSGVLPEYIRLRRKDPMSYSSRLHERIRLYRPLFARLYRSCGYELAGPLRRDFSYVLRREGLDLDRALEADQAAADHTPLEHARDLAGAVRWNLTTMARQLTARR